ncbi:hypothetical protein [Herpetosiphon gulosus]|uniref:Three-Cys-motif partner protein TcmP n=1 Tax=Herpetosiphon gulosus TaxID=1973496 RepID=A0ABP9WU01_9CHLR
MLQSQAQRWSERKVSLVQTYLPLITPSLSPHQLLVIFDGEAGSVRYGSGRWATAGAAIHYQRLANQTKAAIQIILRTTSPEQQAAWQQASEQQFKFWPHDQLNFTQLTSELAANPSLIILDGAFGLIPISNGLDQLARRLARTDLILRFDRAGLTNLLAQREQQPTQTERQLDQLFASRNWRTIVNESPSETMLTALQTFYLQQLTELGGSRWRWAAACTIHTTWGQKAYDLLIATSDRSLVLPFNQCLYQFEGALLENPEAQALLQNAGNPQQIGLFDPALPSKNQLRRQQHAQIVAAITAIASQQPRLWSYGDLLDTLLRQSWLGQLTEAQFQKACNELLGKKLITRLGTSSEWQSTTLLRLGSTPAEPAS